MIKISAILQHETILHHNCFRRIMYNQMAQAWSAVFMDFDPGSE